LSSFPQNPAIGRVSPIDVYACGLAAAALALATGLVAVGADLGGPVWEIAVLGAIAMWAERQPVRVNANAEMTVSVIPVLFAAVVFGPLAAMLVGTLGLITDFGRPHVRWVVWTAHRAIGGGLAGITAATVFSDGDSFERLIAGVIAAALVEAVADAGLGAFTIFVRGTTSLRVFVDSMRPVVVGTVPLYTPVIVLLAYAYQEVSAWTLFLFFAPAFAAQSLYRLYREQREATDQLTEANARLERANVSFATALVAALDARDGYTAGHSAAVAVHARKIAERLGLSDEEQQLAHLCGLLHDIGKVGVPAGILEKPGPLTLEERRQMQEHSVIGERILSKVDDYAEISKIVRHHHERIDGQGYPDGLVGRSIPLISKIIAVADAYDAMTSGRPYRDAMPSRVARLRLAQAVETQFDTAVVAAFEAILAAASARGSEPAAFDPEVVEERFESALTIHAA
jgi:putative nucleotidyltransferase with HDIG domain